jgi:hypothetical protein
LLTRSFRSRATLQLEILALRHQLTVLNRSVKRPKLTTVDRLLWVWLCRVWPDWRSALVIVKTQATLCFLDYTSEIPGILGVRWS